MMKPLKRNEFVYINDINKQKFKIWKFPIDPMDEEKLKEEKVRLENKLKEMCQKTENERNLERIKLLNEYNSVKDAVQVYHY